MPEQNNSPVVSVRLDSEDEALIRQAAKLLKWSRSYIVRAMIHSQLEDLRYRRQSEPGETQRQEG